MKGNLERFEKLGQPSVVDGGGKLARTKLVSGSQVGDILNKVETIKKIG